MGLLDVMGDRRTVGIAVCTWALVFGGALHSIDSARRAADKDASWLRQRLTEKRTLVRALQSDLADVAHATERVSQMASIAREHNVAVRRQAALEEPRDVGYTPARLAVLDDPTANHSDDGARAIAQLAFLEEQLAATTDSLSLLMALSKTSPVGDPVTSSAKRARGTVRPAIVEASTPGGWPVVGEVSSRFGLRASPWGSGTQRHQGVDIAADYGTPVRVSAPGTVVFAGRDSGGYGKTVVVDHGRNVKTLYGHLSGIYVREGQRLEARTVIGAVGNTGRSTGVHLHYEVRVGNVPVDPMLYVRGGGAERVASASAVADPR
jgi:murein DD-endopeptidase MepM/ murein hydrolase activator NlpD